MEERDRSRWMTFEVELRDEAAFLRLIERLPDAEPHETDAYGCVERRRSTSMWLVRVAQ